MKIRILAFIILLSLLHIAYSFTLAFDDRNVCKKKNGNFPKPGSYCRSYYECWNWRPIENTCPEDQHFFPAKGYCVWPEEYPCLEKPKSKECPLPDGKFLKPNTGCKMYYDCCKGIPSEKRCAADLLFDQTKEKCEWPELAFCPEEPESNKCPRPYGRFLKSRTGCKIYFECRKGVATEKICPEDQLFDPARGKCEWPEIYTCVEVDFSTTESPSSYSTSSVGIITSTLRGTSTKTTNSEENTSEESGDSSEEKQSSTKSKNKSTSPSIATSSKSTEESDSSEEKQSSTKSKNKSTSPSISTSTEESHKTYFPSSDNFSESPTETLSLNSSPSIDSYSRTKTPTAAASTTTHNISTVTRISEYISTIITTAKDISTDTTTSTEDISTDTTTIAEDISTVTRTSEYISTDTTTTLEDISTDTTINEEISSDTTTIVEDISTGTTTIAEDISTDATIIAEDISTDTTTIAEKLSTDTTTTEEISSDTTTIAEDISTDTTIIAEDISTETTTIAADISTDTTTTEYISTDTTTSEDIYSKIIYKNSSPTAPLGNEETDSTTITSDITDTVTFHIFCPKSDGYFPHPNDRHKFIACVGGNPTIMDCPANLVYDHKKRSCEYDKI